MGARFQTYRSLEQLRELMPDARFDEAVMGRVLERFCVRLTDHLAERLSASRPLRRQFLPDTREVTTLEGQQVCFSGLMPTGVRGVERLYPDRCAIMPQQVCPAYCRYCFRKFYDHDRGGTAMSYDELERAARYVAGDSRLREVLITGGEPMIDPRRLFFLMRRLRELEHVGPLRVACRSLVIAPELIDEAMVERLVSFQDLRRGKPVEIASHINHPDEISPQTVDRLASLREAGLQVYNQTVLLRGINCDAEILLSLFDTLRRHGVESYYLFFAGPVMGMDHQRPRLDDALAIKSTLRARATGRANPRLIVTTRLGKVELGVDGEIVEREADGRHVWIRTAYTLTGYREIDPGFALPADARLDRDGRIVVRYLDGPSPRPGGSD